MKKQGVQYLAVPYRDKAKARRAGASWDKSAGLWYAPKDIALDGLVQWLPAKNRAPVVGDTQAVRDEFAAALRGAELVLDGPPEMDGTLRRVKVDGDRGSKRSGAYVGFLDGHPAGYINNFKTGVQMNWKSQVPAASLSDVERLALRLDAMERRNQRLQIQTAAAERSRRVLAVTGAWPAY